MSSVLKFVRCTMHMHSMHMHSMHMHSMHMHRVHVHSQFLLPQNFSFLDFFSLDQVAKEYDGLNMITFQEFLEREVMTGHVLDNKGKPMFPPNNRTDWTGMDDRIAKATLDPWIRNFAVHPQWGADACMLAIPSTPTGPAQLQNWTQDVIKTTQEQRQRKIGNNPGPVNAPGRDRLEEVLAHRTQLCLYDETFQQLPILHLTDDVGFSNRVLAHWYDYLFFQDWRQDLWAKRFVRDHLRYRDEIQCASARIVAALRARCNGDFHTMHIRRGDFRGIFKGARVFSNASDIYAMFQDMIPDNSCVYFATDEKDKSYFDVFNEHYQIFFLDDFKDLLRGVDTNYYGMIEQVVASRGETFVGCYYSTFSAYINRLRGYHSQKMKADGWEKGIIKSWYYMPEFKDAHRTYMSVGIPLFAREYPIAWRDIDKDVDEAAM
jgi:hypothetical protein